MPRPLNPVDEAFERVAVLRSILSAERQRALATPLHARNVALGILTDRGYEDREKAEREIIAIFNALELLLDHFNIMHMAASFEQAAGARIGNALGVARTAVEKGRKVGERWPARLLRDAKSYQSLESISDLLNLPPDDMEAFGMIRKVRNALSHGAPVTDVPTITGDDARVVLTEALERLKV